MAAGGEEVHGCAVAEALRVAQQGVAVDRDRAGEELGDLGLVEAHEATFR